MYDITKYNGPVIGSLRNSEYEEIARRILTKCKEAGKIVGVDREEVEIPTDIHHALRRGEDFNYIDDLIKEEFLVQEGNKLYPTEKLLENQKVPKI